MPAAPRNCRRVAATREQTKPSGGGYHPSMDRNDFRRELAQQLRVDSSRSSDAGGSGHPTSSMSAADLMAVLLDGHLKLDFDDPTNRAGDHLVFSKGHASPLLYACFKAAGAISDEKLLSFRKLGSPFEGHPTPVLPWVDVATGSLGQGLPVTAGLALAAKRFDGSPSRVWCLCGDSEMAEGSIWEAFDHASHWELDNLVAIVDVNRLGQTGETMHGWDLGLYADRARAFGWETIEVDGHDVEAIEEAYTEAEQVEGRPAVVLARTKKGAGVKAVEDQPGKHGKPVEDAEAAIAELGGERTLTVKVAKPEGAAARGSDGASAAAKSPPARPTARPSRRSATPVATWSPSTARSPTPPTARSSATPIRTATSSSTSPSSSSSRPRSPSSGAAGSRSAPPSRPSSQGPTTSSAW